MININKECIYKIAVGESKQKPINFFYVVTIDYIMLLYNRPKWKTVFQ